MSKRKKRNLTRERAIARVVTVNGIFVPGLAMVHKNSSMKLVKVKNQIWVVETRKVTDKPRTKIIDPKMTSKCCANLWRHKLIFEHLRGIKWRHKSNLSSKVEASAPKIPPIDAMLSAYEIPAASVSNLIRKSFIVEPVSDILKPWKVNLKTKKNLRYMTYV